MNWKNILSIIGAVVGGYLLLKVFMALLGIVFSIAVTILQIVFIAVIAAPLYVIIRKKLLS